MKKWVLLFLLIVLLTVCVSASALDLGTLNVGQKIQGYAEWDNPIEVYFSPSTSGEYIIHLNTSEDSAFTTLSDGTGATIQELNFGKNNSFRVNLQANVRYKLYARNKGMYGIKEFMICFCEEGNHASLSDTWVIETAPTCTESGKELRYCDGCGFVAQSQMIPPTGHSAGTMKVEKTATCAESGIERIRCKVCNAIIEENELPSPEHMVSDAWITTLAPTCTEDGIEVQNCMVCGNAINSRTILSTGHQADHYHLDEATNKQIRECAVCHEVLESLELPVTVIGPLWTCSECNNIQAFGNYCFECGARRPGLVICPNCKAIMPEGYSGAFCSECGTKLSE